MILHAIYILYAEINAKIIKFAIYEDTQLSLLIKITDLSVGLSVQLYISPYALTPHTDILDSESGHIFWKYRHKNNKKVTLIYEKTVKTLLLLEYLPASFYVARTFKE